MNCLVTFWLAACRYLDSSKSQLGNLHFNIWFLKLAFSLEVYVYFCRTGLFMMHNCSIRVVLQPNLDSVFELCVKKTNEITRT